MAARGGHLELCKFLLREAAHPNEDAILRFALYYSLNYATNAFQWEHRARKGRLLLEASYDLYVGEYALNADQSDVNKSITQIGYENPLFLTNNSFQVILACQELPFINLPYVQRFAIAVDSVGWPAEAFSTLLHHDSINLAAMTTKHGKTALH